VFSSGMLFCSCCAIMPLQQLSSGLHCSLCMQSLLCVCCVAVQHVQGVVCDINICICVGHLLTPVGSLLLSLLLAGLALGR
jgi:hypothetical protein